MCLAEAEREGLPLGSIGGCSRLVIPLETITADAFSSGAVLYVNSYNCLLILLVPAERVGLCLVCFCFTRSLV